MNTALLEDRWFSSKAEAIATISVISIGILVFVWLVITSVNGMKTATAQLATMNKNASEACSSVYPGSHASEIVLTNERDFACYKIVKSAKINVGTMTLL